MRIHFVGNTCNNHYVIVKELRQQGVDARLFLPHCHTVTPQTQPESEDPELVDGYPSWIKLLKKVSWFHPIGAIGRKDKVDLLNCDLVVTHGEYAPAIGRKRPNSVQSLSP